MTDTAVPLSDALPLAEALHSAGLAYLSDALPLSDAESILFRRNVFLTDTLTLTEALPFQSWTSPSAATGSFTNATTPTGTWADQDASPRDAGHTVWAMGDLVVPERCDEDILSDMFCEQPFPFALATDCTTFSFSSDAGSGPRIDDHSLEEIPGTDLVVGLIVPSSAPHTDVATLEVEGDTGYATGTKTVLDASETTQVGAMRVHPFSQTMVIVYPTIGGIALTTAKVIRIPWVNGAFDYSAATTTTLKTGMSLFDRSCGVFPLADGSWIVFFLDIGASRTLYWSRSTDDGVTWGALSSLVDADFFTVKGIMAGEVPVIGYSTNGTGTLKLRALNVDTDTWGTAVTVSALNSNQSISLAAPFDENRVGAFYETDTLLPKLNIYTVTTAGVLALESTEAVAGPTDTFESAGTATYSTVAGAGRSWITFIIDAGNDIWMAQRLDTTGATWSATEVVLSSATPGSFQVPVIPRCAATIPFQEWLSGNTIFIKRFAL